MIFLRHGNMENCRSCRWKTIHNLMEKDKPFPQVCKQLSHSLAILAVYAHFHNAYYGGYPSFPIQS